MMACATFREWRVCRVFVPCWFSDCPRWFGLSTTDDVCRSPASSCRRPTPSGVWWC